MPKKFSTTHEPLRCDRSNGWPSMVVARTAGAGWSSSGVLGRVAAAALGLGEHHDEHGQHDGHAEGGEQDGAAARAAAAPPAARRSRLGSMTSTIVGAHQLGRRRRRRALAWPTGADTGSIGRRRRPGKAASTVPMAMMAAPTHSHSTNGTTRTVSVVVPSASGWRSRVR